MKSNADSQSYNQNDVAIRFTPRQLIKYHMEHPEVPITDKDIENLIFDIPGARHFREESQLSREDKNINHTNNRFTPTTLL